MSGAEELRERFAQRAEDVLQWSDLNSVRDQLVGIVALAQLDAYEQGKREATRDRESYGRECAAAALEDLAQRYSELGAYGAYCVARSRADRARAAALKGSET